MKQIVSYYETWTPEDLEFGEASDRGLNDKVDMEPDDVDLADGKTSVDLAVAYLEQEGVNEVSSSPWTPRSWYIAIHDQDWRTGNQTQNSYHLKDFSPEEEKEIAQRLFPSVVRENKKVTKITKSQLRKMVKESVKSSLSEQTHPGDLTDEEWRQMAAAIQDVRGRAYQLESLHKALVHLLEKPSQNTAAAIARNYAKNLEPRELALLQRLSKKLS